MAGLGAAGRFDALSAFAQDDEYTPLQRFPRMMQEYMTGVIDEIDLKNRLLVDALNTREDALEFVRSARERIRRSFGPAPEKTPLNPRVVKRTERDAYVIENVIFESRPGFLVTANLYLPKGKPLPAPGVIGTCGHSATGKAYEFYQSFAQALARMGYVVLIYDPISQGERIQYPTGDGKSRYGIGVGEHIQAGNQQFLVNEFIGAWRAWDGIRALDYLLSRVEVDPNHVGVTGNSGGGTMTTWLCGLDDRFTMAAPGCFVTTFRRNLENELPADTEQCPPHALALGLDHFDFIAAMAPKPVILLGKEKDFFDVRGLIEAHRRLKRIYKLLGAEDRIGLFIGPTEHGYSLENREAMYRWFNQVTGVSDAQSEPALTVEKDETLWCTPNGQVHEMNSRKVYSFTREKSLALAARRTPLKGEALKQAVINMLRLPHRAGAPDFRILRPMRGRGYPAPSFSTYAIETEPGVFAPTYYLTEERLQSRPPRGEKAILYVSDLSSDEELRSEPMIRDLIKAEPDAALFAFDARGVGESLPNTCGSGFFDPYGPDYFYAIHSIMLDRPYLGQKTHDVLCVLDWLASYGYRGVHLASRGRGAFIAVFAALLHDGVKRITLKNSADSYAAIAETEDYAQPLSVLLPGVLERFDLPDCYAELQSRQLKRI